MYQVYIFYLLSTPGGGRKGGGPGTMPGGGGSGRKGGGPGTMPGGGGRKGGGAVVVK